LILAATFYVFCSFDSLRPHTFIVLKQESAACQDKGSSASRSMITKGRLLKY